GDTGINQLNVLAAIDLRLLEDLLDACRLLVIGGDDELAALAMRHAVGGAVVVEHPPRARAVQRAPGPGRIVEPGMDDLAVARGWHGADGIGGLRHDDLVPPERQLARAGEPDHSRPHD